MSETSTARSHTRREFFVVVASGAERGLIRARVCRRAPHPPPSSRAPCLLPHTAANSRVVPRARVTAHTPKSTKGAMAAPGGLTDDLRVRTINQL